MKDLTIFPFEKRAVVDSHDVAEVIGRPHRQLLRTIQTMIEHLKSARGKHTFALSDFFIPATYMSEQGKEMPCFYCTQMGCDLVANKMTGEKGTVFTALYVERFHEMDKELAKRAALRELDKPTQRTLTDAIRDSGENEHMKGHAYNTYINLAYKAALGLTASQLRKERGAAKTAKAVDFLTSDELAAVGRAKQHVIALLDMGLLYDEIKPLLLRKGALHG